MKISKQARRGAKSLFRNSMVNGRMDEAKVRQAVQLLIEKKPRGYVAMLSHLQRLVKMEVARRTALVESATDLSQDMQQNVRARLEAAYGSGLTLNFKVNPALIGGLRMKVGSDVYDGSVRGRLEAIEKAA